VRLVLGGASAVAIAERFGDSPRAVSKWVERFETFGVAGLADARRSGRPSSLSPAQEKRLSAFIERTEAKSERMSGGILANYIAKHFRVTLTRRQCERILRRVRVQRRAS
jgi:transposase